MDWMFLLTMAGAIIAGLIIGAVIAWHTAPEMDIF